MDLQRVEQNHTATLTKTFQVDGVATDPSPATATIQIVRADGTVLVPAGTATTRTTVGTFTYNITTAQTGLLDNLTAYWTSSLGVLKQQVEIVGGFLFTIAEARTAIGDTAYSATKIAEARTYAESELESALGYALVPRYARETLTGYAGSLRLRPYLRSIRSATVNTSALSAASLAELSFDTTGRVNGYSWSSYSDLGNVTVGYEHGLSFPPAGAKRAALALALDSLGTDTSGIDPRAETIITVDGTIRLRNGSGPFSALGVNEWINANRIPAIA